jgi:hypothetical protein
MARLEACVGGLRRRDQELEKSLSVVGSGSSFLNRRLEPETEPQRLDHLRMLEERRARTRADLTAMREEVGRQLEATMVAIENLRLSLLRLKSGFDLPEELQEYLNAAKRIDDEVQSLLDGEKAVGVLLAKTPIHGESGHTTDPAVDSYQP